MAEEQDLTAQYNTKLTPEEEADYQSWAKSKGMDPEGATYDYDMRGAFKSGVAQADNGHFPDTYKKPNHMTFSDQSQYSTGENKGGKWSGGEDGQPWHFIPSATNMQMHDSGTLQHYFDTVEKGNIVDLGGPPRKLTDPLMDGRPEGARQLQMAVDAGAKPDDVNAWAMGQAKMAIDQGANPRDVQKFFGWDPEQTDIGPAKAHVEAGISQLTPEDHTKIAGNPMEYIAAGLQASSGGLLALGKPTLKMPDNPSLFQNILGTFGSAVGDIPAMVAGGALGAPVGGAAGEAVGGPVGGVIGGLAGVGAGSSALPAALRSSLNQIYAQNPNATFKDVWSGMTKVAWDQVAKETGKAALAGAVAGPVAGPLGSKVAEAGAPLLGSAAAAVSGRAAEMTAFGATATTVGAALDGKVPDGKDFVTGAALAVGFGLAHVMVAKGVTNRPVTTETGDALAKNLQDVYVDTGLHPVDVGRVASQDTSVREEVLAPTSADGTRVTPLLDQMKLKEPEPYKQPITGFHGSPQDFDEFDINKVGVGGEGTQQEGHGLYFGENRKVGEAYQAGFGDKGNLYQANLHTTPEEMIQWNKPLSEQPSIVKKAINKLLPDATTDMTGEEAYKAIAKQSQRPSRGDEPATTVQPDEAKASSQLRALGVKGTQYSDKYSVEGDPSGTRNSVMFDHRDIEITHKNGEPVEQVRENATADRLLSIQGDNGEWEPPTGTKLVEGGGEPPEEPPVERPALPAPEEPGRPEFVKNNDYRKSIIADIIAPEEKGPGFFRSTLGNVRSFIAQFQAKLTPGRELDRELKTLGEHTEENQIKAPHDLGIEDMWRMTLSSRANANFMLRHGGLARGDGKFTRTDAPSFTDAFDQVKKDGGNTQDFYLYRLAARTVEKAKQGIDTGIPLDVALAHISDPANIKMYAEGSRIIRDAKNGIVDFYQQSGMLSPERAADMKDLNQEHIVFDRVVDPNWQAGMGKKGTSQLKRMEGSKKQITDPAEAEIYNVHSMVANANRNVAIGNMVHYIEMSGEQERYMTKLEPKELGLDLDTGALLKQELLDENGKIVPQAEKEAALPFLATKAFNGVRGPNDFIYFRNGVPEVWRASDPRVTELVRAQSAAHNPNILVSAMRFGAKVAGYGITGDPSFVIRSASHGQIASAVAGENHVFPFRSIVEGLPQAIKDMTGLDLSDHYKDFLAHGGGTALTDIDRIKAYGDMDYTAEKTGMRDRVWNVVKSPIAAVQAIQHVMHTAAQYGNYKNNLRAGAAPMKAFNLSSTNMLDFREGLGGAGAQEFSTWVRFMNVGLKDIEQFGRAMQDRPAETLARGFMYLTVPALALAAANHAQDQFLKPGDRYSDLPQYIRDGYFVFPSVNGFRFKWPKPYVLNYMFTQPVDDFMDYLAGKGRTGMDAMHSLAQSFIPPMVPNTLVPIGEQLTNEHFVSQTPLIPGSMEQLSGYMQYGPTTSPEAIAASRLLGEPRPALPGGVANISPIVLENYFKQWGGSLPYELAHAINGHFQPESTHNQGIEHDLFTKSFFLTHSDFTPKPMEDAYDMINAFKASHGDLVKAIKEGDFNRAFPRDQMMAMQKVTAFEKALSGINKAIKMFNEDEHMPLNDKQKQIDSIYTNALPMIESYTKQLKQQLDQAGKFQGYGQ